MQDQAEDFQRDRAEQGFIACFAQDDGRVKCAMRQRQAALADAPLTAVPSASVNVISRSGSSPMSSQTGVGSNEYVAPLSTSNRTDASPPLGPRATPST